MEMFFQLTVGVLTLGFLNFGNSMSPPVSIKEMEKMCKCENVVLGEDGITEGCMPPLPDMCSQRKFWQDRSFLWMGEGSELSPGIPRPLPPKPDIIGKDGTLGSSVGPSSSPQPAGLKPDEMVVDTKYTKFARLFPGLSMAAIVRCTCFDTPTPGKGLMLSKMCMRPSECTDELLAAGVRLQELLRGDIPETPTEVPSPKVKEPGTIREEIVDPKYARFADYFPGFSMATIVRCTCFDTPTPGKGLMLSKMCMRPSGCTDELLAAGVRLQELLRGDIPETPTEVPSPKIKEPGTIREEIVDPKYTRFAEYFPGFSMAAIVRCTCFDTPTPGKGLMLSKMCMRPSGCTDELLAAGVSLQELLRGDIPETPTEVPSSKVKEPGTIREEFVDPKYARFAEYFPGFSMAAIVRCTCFDTPTPGKGLMLSKMCMRPSGCTDELLAAGVRLQELLRGDIPEPSTEVPSPKVKEPGTIREEFVDPKYARFAEYFPDLSMGAIVKCMCYDGLASGAGLGPERMCVRPAGCTDELTAAGLQLEHMLRDGPGGPVSDSGKHSPAEPGKRTDKEEEAGTKYERFAEYFSKHSMADVEKCMCFDNLEFAGPGPERLCAEKGCTTELIKAGLTLEQMLRAEKQLQLESRGGDIGSEKFSLEDERDDFPSPEADKDKQHDKTVVMLPTETDGKVVRMPVDVDEKSVEKSFLSLMSRDKAEDWYFNLTYPGLPLQLIKDCRPCNFYPHRKGDPIAWCLSKVGCDREKEAWGSYREFREKHVTASGEPASSTLTPGDKTSTSTDQSKRDTFHTCNSRLVMLTGESEVTVHPDFMETLRKVESAAARYNLSLIIVPPHRRDAKSSTGKEGFECRDMGLGLNFHILRPSNTYMYCNGMCIKKSLKKGREPMTRFITALRADADHVQVTKSGLLVYKRCRPMRIFGSP